jgi:ubiquinone/menaquinone biosynthesis C-methylase UbiE
MTSLMCRVEPGDDAGVSCPDSSLHAMRGPVAVRSYFDSLADEYARGRETQSSFRAQRAAVLGLLASARGRILDVGCGPALLAPHLLELGFEVWAIDLAPEMIARGHARLAAHPERHRVHLLVGDAERLAFPDAFFDAVVSMGVFEYLASYGPALDQVRRVLRPGGIVVLSLPNRLSTYHVAREAIVMLRAAARRALARPGHAASPPVNRCVPRLFDRELARHGLAPRRARRGGAQYVVQAQKR